MLRQATEVYIKEQHLCGGSAINIIYAAERFPQVDGHWAKVADNSMIGIDIAI